MFNQEESIMMTELDTRNIMLNNNTDRTVSKIKGKLRKYLVVINVTIYVIVKE
jgi:hypothetical protein